MNRKLLKSLIPKGTAIFAIIILSIVLTVSLYKQASTVLSKEKKAKEISVYKTIVDKAIPIIQITMKPEFNRESHIWLLKGTITSGFGMRKGAFHQGIDIAAPTGTPIYAFMDGKVVYSGWESGYGNLVVIDHENGMKSFYGHNSRLVVSTGQVVAKGQCISQVGSTGDSTGPHCHFEIRVNGTPENPLQYLNQNN